MASHRTLGDALVVEPGVTCLDRKSLLADLLSWRESERVDQRVAIRVVGSSKDPRELSFALWIRDALAVERRFAPAPEDCADLHATVALAIAIALDDTLAEDLGIAAPVEQIQPGEGDLPSFEAARARERPLRPGPALALTLAAGVFVGPTPRLSGGGELFFDIRPLDHFDVRLGALATHLSSAPVGDGEVAVTVAAGRLDLCWATAPLSVRLRLCGGFAGGATRSRARGFYTDFARSTPYFAAIPSIDVAVHVIGPLALELRVEGLFQLQRTTLEVRSPGGQLLAAQPFPIAGFAVAVGPRFEF